jgi:phosphoribosyl-ATP pyrophosphohydrolase/phosphoribosyl-AMP cyclohydrolase
MSVETAAAGHVRRDPMIELGFSLDDLVYDSRGLLPVVVQDIAGGSVLMVAWANREAIALTAQTATAHFWSRSRKQLWQKGETSKNVLDVEEILVDCDRDTLLYRAHPRGPTCHLGTASCFDPKPAAPSRGTLELGWLAAVIAQRRTESSSTSSYTRRLLDEGLERVAQKVGEEAVEVVIAALGDRSPSSEAGDPESAGTTPRVVSETADLLYHLLVLLEALDVDVRAVADELSQRHRSKRAQQAKPSANPATDDEVEP